MTESIKMFDLAQLAEAAYANFFNNSGELLTNPLDISQALQAKEFSETQAVEFVSNWRVVHHIPDTENGFSATVFERLNADGSGSGQYSLAIRGSTQIYSDFVADAGIIASAGIANAQVVDMYNYWQSLNTSAGTTYQAAVLVTLASSEIDNYPYYQRIYDAGTETFKTIKFVDSSTLADSTLRQGSGTFTSIPGALDVSGHSLGGHLAMAFTRLFPSVNAEATAINGLGFKLNNADVDDFFSMLDGDDFFNSTQIQNIYGIDGPEFAAMNNFALQQPGGWTGIFIEDGSLISAQVGGHGIKQMTDSLAVADLLIQLDATLAGKTPQQALAIINALLQKASATAATTLENLIASLSQTIIGADKPQIITDDRESLYSAIKTLTDNPSYQSLTGKLTLSTSLPTVTEARADFGAFLSLIYLTPFTLKAGTLEAQNLLKNTHASLGYQWDADSALTAEQRANGEASYSDFYLADRAAMLSWQNKLNAEDFVDSGFGYLTTANATNDDYWERSA